MQEESHLPANVSNSSLDSFHSALSNPHDDPISPSKPPQTSQVQPSNFKSPISPSPPTTPTQLTPNQTPIRPALSRTRWFFGGKEKSPIPPHPSPLSPSIASNAFKIAPKRPRIRRSRHENESVDTRSSSHPFNRNVSDRSSLASSADDKRINPIPYIRSPQNLHATLEDSSQPSNLHSHPSSTTPFFSTLPRSVTTPAELSAQNKRILPSTSIQPQTQSIEPPSAYNQDQAELFDDNWGLDDISDTDTDFDTNRDHFHNSTNTSNLRQQYPTTTSSLEAAPSRTQPNYESTFPTDAPRTSTTATASVPSTAFDQANSSIPIASNTPPPSYRDTITLRAYDDKIHAGSNVADSSQLTGVDNLIGVYADPAAETDDWGDDFVLETDSERPGDASTGSRTGDEGPSSVPTWFIDKDIKRNVEFGDVEVYDNVSIGGDSSVTGPRTAINPSAAEIVARGDEALPIRVVPPVAFVTPGLTHASLLKFPGIGYEMATVHPSCIRVKELFSRYNAKLKRHFDALVRDCGGTIALDEKTRTLYLMCDDRDVQKLAESYTDLSAEVLLWKLTWASIQDDRKEQARILLALSEVYRENGNVRDAISLINDGIVCLKEEDKFSCYTLSLATELEYMRSVLHRGLGEFTAADEALREAINYSNTLVQRAEDPDDLNAPQQRGIWWQLRCKFLQAEIAYDMKQLELAVQYYAEYIVESMTRMIGLISPPRSDDTTLGAEFMRYCLFSPRRLVLALWMIVLSLGELRCFGAAADVASLTSMVASAFGYHDANKAVSSIRGRLKEIGVELRQQYDEISRTILQSESLDQDELAGSSGDNKISRSPFEYDGDDFGNVMDDEIEDWDAQLERELNITIERCDVAQSINMDGNNSIIEGFNHEASQTSFEQQTNTTFEREADSTMEARRNTETKTNAAKQSASQTTAQRWAVGSQQGPLIEAELRNYLSRITGAASTLSARQMYPKPTQPFDGTLMGPREHETFMRHFVRGKDPAFVNRYTHDPINTSLWYPSGVCRLNLNIDPIHEIDASDGDKQILSDKWAMMILDAVWKIVRSEVPITTKLFRVRRLVLQSFKKAVNASRETPVHKEAEIRSRLHALAALIESLRLAREVVSQDGSDATWFSRASNFLSQVAATVTPTAKSFVELFHAESRAHCGIRAIEPVSVLERCATLTRLRKHNGNTSFSPKQDGISANGASSDAEVVPPYLRQSVVDVMHGLYWRTKAGFDESSDKKSLERFVHAEVTSSLYFTGCGVSPVDGSAIDLSPEMDIFETPYKTKESADTSSLVDETRRVSASELIQELQSLWSTLPSSAGIVRAKVSFALAHHSEVDRKDYASAERFLFDGLCAIWGIRRTRSMPLSFFSRLLSISPVAIVSRPLVGAILQSYGRIALSHSKYRYGIAALEAAADGLLVRNLNKQHYRSSVLEVAETAISNNDWRRGLSMLYMLRSMMHPKDGLRNEFLFLCLRIHRICFDAGCLDASIVPLRAYSALIYEERLRVLLQKYRRRLAKKSRSKFRRYLPGSPLPKLLPGGSVFSNRRNSLASFFETPLPLVTAAIDTTIRQSMSAMNNKGRSSAVAAPNSSAGGNTHLKRLAAYLWPVPVPISRKGNKKREESKTTDNKSTPSRQPRPVDSKLKNEPPATSNKASLSPKVYPDAEFEEKQRELLRIEAEQEATADYNRLKVELLRVQTEFAKGDYKASELRCKGLLELSISHDAKYSVYEILARIRLKRREITNCLEFVDKMEREYYFAKESNDNSDRTASQTFHEVQRVSLFRLHDSEKEVKHERSKRIFIPQVTFLRVTALLHGGRLQEALSLSDEALGLCDEHSFWNRGRLHYLRGKVLNAMSSTSTAPFQRESYISTESLEPTHLTLRVIELTIGAFETASHYFSLAGDEISTAKADLLWARTCIDFLFRRVVLTQESGGGLSLQEACALLDREINLVHVIDAIYDVLSVASTANIPLLVIDTLAALAEVKCIQKQAPSSWMLWVSEAWKLFSRLFTDAEDFTVVLTKLAPVSTLLRLQNLCGRLVRLIMCNDQIVSIEDMNKHLRLFETYVTLQITVDQKMNLESSVHTDETSFEEKDHGAQADDVNLKENPDQSNVSGAANNDSEQVRSNSDSADEDENGTMKSETKTTGTTPHRPAGAFLHMLGNEGVALGRQGFSLFINRPRQQVISAVKGTGAVLIPTNFFSTSKSVPGSEPHELGKDAEMIYPFKPSLGLGAMQILNDDIGEEDVWNTQGHNMSLQDIWTYNTGSGFHPGATFRSEASLLEKNENMRTMIDRESSIPDVSGHETKPAVSNRERPTAENEDKDNTMQKSTSIETEEGKNASGAESTDETEENVPQKPKFSMQNALATLITAIAEEAEQSIPLTKGSSSVFGDSTAARVWAHMHRIKVETRRYMHGGITLEQLHDRNNDALLGWIHCIPLSRTEWTVPESISRRVVYSLYAHGIIGYYAVDRGGSIERVAFGGKQGLLNTLSARYPTSANLHNAKAGEIRAPTDAEKLYLYELVGTFRKEEGWHKSRDSEVVHGMANSVLRTPPLVLRAASPAQKSRSRPIVLIADFTLQVLPWELFFDHVVIRSHCLLDVIRQLQERKGSNANDLLSTENPTKSADRKITRFICFGPSRREAIDLERSEEARRQQLAFQGLLRLNLMTPSSLIEFLDLGGFSAPTAINATKRPTGPLACSLTQSRKALKLLGLRIAPNIGKRNYPHMDFLRVSGLGSATTWDLKEAAMMDQPITNDKDELIRDLGAHIPVFMFSYADLLHSTNAVFGLRRLVPQGILMFTPAIHMKVLARHLQDDELSAELQRVSGQVHNHMIPDVIASARALVEYVSKFSREKRIPIVVFLGEGLVDVFTNNRFVRMKTERRDAPVADRLVQLSSATHLEYFRRTESMVT